MKAMQRLPSNPIAEHLDISFQPMGTGRTWRVARAWNDEGFVRWSSPCLDESHEHADIQAFEQQFGDCACSLPAFIRAMEWLDAVCFGAKSLDAVWQACLLDPEYGLVCLPFESTTNNIPGNETA